MRSTDEFTEGADAARFGGDLAVGIDIAPTAVGVYAQPGRGAEGESSN